MLYDTVSREYKMLSSPVRIATAEERLLKADASALTLDTSDIRAATTIALPATGSVNGSAITWASSDSSIIAPATGTTMALLAAGISSTPVTLAAKSLLRGGRPVIIAPSTNDGLSGSAPALGQLLQRRSYYFVPFGQDDSYKKPCSLKSDFTLLPDTLEAALRGVQIQPLLL